VTRIDHLSPSEQRRIWDAKPVLRTVYGEYFEKIAAARVPGVSVEIGAGSGGLGDFVPAVWSTDIVHSAFVNVVADAQALPFPEGSISNIVGVDVLHHLEFPALFFAEAERVLRDGGRIILVEPAITPISRLFFKLFHPEPVDLDADPFVVGKRDPERRPFDSNQAIPTLVAGRHRDRFHRRHATLRVATARRLSLLAYPLSGGFRPWALVPVRWVPFILRLERILAPFIGRLMAFRLLLVIDRSPRRRS
jgi:SAM-dependent methyltransferase